MWTFAPQLYGGKRPILKALTTLIIGSRLNEIVDMLRSTASPSLIPTGKIFVLVADGEYK